jgi:hypothetical protein
MITHKPSTTVVFQTNNYSVFSFLKGNRAINKKKVDRIVKEIKAGNDMLPYYPIQVRVQDNQLIILDGQHRFYISNKLKKPVHYILVTDPKSMTDIAKVNSNVEKWKHADFINCYITAGIEDYKILNNFIKAYNFSLGICLYLLTEGHPGKPSGSQPELYEEFMSGKFRITRLKEARAFAEIMKRFEKFKNWRNRNFIVAIYRIIKAEKVTIEEVVEAFNRYPGMLKEQATFKDYIYNIEQIMNVGRKIRIVIS